MYVIQCYLILSLATTECEYNYISGDLNLHPIIIKIKALICKKMRSFSLMFYLLESVISVS